MREDGLCWVLRKEVRSKKWVFDLELWIRKRKVDAYQALMGYPSPKLEIVKSF